MAKLTNDLNKLILEFIKANPSLSSKEIANGIDSGFGYASVKRALQKLIAEKLIIATGTRKGTKYQLSPEYDLLFPIDIDLYFQKEIDERKIIDSFNHSLIFGTLGMFQSLPRKN